MLADSDAVVLALFKVWVSRLTNLKSNGGVLTHRRQELSHHRQNHPHRPAREAVMLAQCRCACRYPKICRWLMSKALLTGCVQCVVATGGGAAVTEAGSAAAGCSGWSGWPGEPG